MIRSEFLLAGCILVVLGFGLLVAGYDKIQETPIENVVTFLETVSGKAAPDELHPPKTLGYILLGLGGVSLVTGIGTILKSRSVVK
jgi:uncharacterized membrane protein YphA (DoxX/SURF4 family)